MCRATSCVSHIFPVCVCRVLSVPLKFWDGFKEEVRSQPEWAKLSQWAADIDWFAVISLSVLFSCYKATNNATFPDIKLNLPLSSPTFDMMWDTNLPPFWWTAQPIGLHLGPNSLLPHCIWSWLYLFYEMVLAVWFDVWPELSQNPLIQQLVMDRPGLGFKPQAWPGFWGLRAYPNCKPSPRPSIRAGPELGFLSDSEKWLCKLRTAMLHYSTQILNLHTVHINIKIFVIVVVFIWILIF
jgi:hypothetical protein